MFFWNRALLEELLHQLVVAFCDQLYQRLMRLPGTFLKIGRDIRLLALAVPTQLVGIGFHPDQVDNAAQILLAADRQLDGNDVAPESLLQRVKDAVGIGAFTIHAARDNQARCVVFLEYDQTRWVTTSTPATPST